MNYNCLENADPVLYAAKASRWEREIGLESLEPVKVNDGRDTPIDNQYQRGETERRNSHVSVKPIDVTERSVQEARLRLAYWIDVFSADREAA